jgi:glycosyltransferase involved in cell wall biosynthesis
MKRWRIDPDDVTIGYVGSIVHYEGLDYVIQAVALLRDRGVGGFKLLVVGDGRELASLKSLAAKLKVTNLCVFTGRVDRSEVESLYSVIDIVPLPRRSLPVTELVPPLKPFEAMAAGKTVVVSSVEAIALTVIDGQTGIIVPSDNVDKLAEALEKLIENPSLRKEIGARSRNWVQKERSVDSLARRLREVYASVGVEAADS